MSPADKALLSERIGREHQHDRIVKQLDKGGGTISEQLWRIDNDPQWFFTWSRALGFWAKCPSNDVRARVRETIRSRLPAPHLLPEMAVYEPDLDTAEDELEDR